MNFQLLRLRTAGLSLERVISRRTFASQRYLGARKPVVGSVGIAAYAMHGARSFSAAATDVGYIQLDESKHNLEDIIAKNNHCLVYFTASWCGPCKMIAPGFAELAKAHGSSITFIKIDVDDNGSTADSAQIRAVPTFRAYTGGKMTKEWSGANTSVLESSVLDMVATKK